MSMFPAFLDRLVHTTLPCGILLDPDSCPCQDVEIVPSLTPEKELVEEGDGKSTSAVSSNLITKQTTDEIEIAICLDRISYIYGQTLQKLELCASLHALFENPKFSHMLNKDDFEVVTNAFRKYISVEPCSGPCFENLEVPKLLENNAESIHQTTSLGDRDPEIYRAIEILNGYAQVREIVSELGRECSEQAQLFLGYNKYFMEHSLRRMRMSPEECRAKELHYRKLWRDNEKAKMDLRLYAAALDEQRREHDEEMELINSRCEKDLNIVKRINRKCKEDIMNTVIKSERKMTTMYKASELKQKEMREDVSNAESQLKTIRELNLTLEKEARDKRFKIETQLLAAINKYDTEIGEKQKQMEFLIEQFNADKKRKEDLESEIEKQAEMYDAFMKERQEASDAIINEKLAKLMMLRAVKIIQRWWRSIRAKRKIFLAGKKKAKHKKKTKK